MEICLVAGLGNEGSAYRGTRHNFGFEVVDRMAAGQRAAWEKSRHAEAWEARLPGNRILLKPTTMMNASGEAIRAAVDWWKVPLKNFMVIVDDIDLPLGRLRLRAEGSSGGHRGLESIESHLGTREFARLRGGVGRPAGDREAADHVLENFTQEERPVVARMETAAAEAVEAWWQNGWEAALSLGNRKVEA
ncbi:MAG: aminoacyl-tRNA hydrolase [Verrucomicrobia bacterium]|nr:aminoacyl-tRNA hydrolase [Verrucomicrobiota bacterium]